MADQPGGNEGMFDDLAITRKIDFGRKVARMLDTHELPLGTQSRTAVRRLLDDAYTSNSSDRSNLRRQS